MSDNVELCYQFEFERYIFETYNDYPNMDFKQVKQVHSGDVVECADESFDENIKCDGIVSFAQQPPDLAIRTADCLAIGIIGDDGIANVHAGWRGLKQQIIGHPLIAKIKPKQFIIGPHISASNYEVGNEFLDYFNQDVSLEKINNKPFFSQRNEIVHQINSKYPNTSIEICNICTFDSESLHSYRREQGSGRNVSVLRKR